MALSTQPRGIAYRAARDPESPIKNYIGGAWVASRSTEALPLTNPLSSCSRPSVVDWMTLYSIGFTG